MIDAARIRRVLENDTFDSERSRRLNGLRQTLILGLCSRATYISRLSAQLDAWEAEDAA